MAFSPGGTLLASADADGTVRTWHVLLFADPYSAYAALCADVGPPTKAEWTQYAPGQTQPNICSLGCPQCVSKAKTQPRYMVALW